MERTTIINSEMNSTTLDFQEETNIQKTICTLCLKGECRYTCPRCNIQYCSVDCYKSEKHLECSEGFYKDCFMEGLQQHDVSNDERKKMIDMLARVEEDAILNPDSDDEEDLADRVNGLDLDKDTEHIWRRLTDKEKAEFEKMASDGRLGNLIEIWTPWWNCKDGKIQDIEGTDSPKRPSVMKNIPDVTKLLTKSKPSSDLKHNIVNILYSYAYICRLHNGDHLECPSESAIDLLNVSDVINKDVTCTSPEEALGLCLQCMQMSAQRKTSRAFEISIIQDVASILSGPSQEQPLLFVEAALSETHKLFKKAYKEICKEIKSVSVSSSKQKQSEQMKLRLFKTLKKLEFMLGWIQRFGMVLQTLIPEVKLQYCSLSSELSSIEETCQQLEQKWGGKHKPVKPKLVEELT